MEDFATEKPQQTILVPDHAGGAEHPVTVWDAASAQFAARLRKVAKERRKWAAKNGIASYRVYDADLPDYAVAIDLYRAYVEPEVADEDLDDDTWAWPAVEIASGDISLHVAEYEAPKGVDEVKAAHRLADALAIIPVALGVPEDRVFTKTRRRERGGGQYALNREERRANFAFATTEPAYNGEQLLLNVDMNGYLDTGLFLDHRVTRQLVGRLVGERAAAGNPPRFLNLFAYTGSASVHAVVAGAASSATVDLSATYLEWAARNLGDNGFATVSVTAGEALPKGVRHTCERGDTLNWLAAAAAAGRKFDVVFVDPPTFSNSKAMGERTWDVQRDHVALLTAVRRVMAPGAVCVFSCNLRNFRPDGDALAAAGISLTDITAQTIPEDWVRNPKIHKCYTFVKE